VAKNTGTSNWKDIQMVMAAMAMTITIGLWNIFAAGDLASAEEAQAVDIPSPTVPPPTAVLPPTPLPQVKIMLGGQAPQVKVIQQSSNTRRNRDNGGGSVATTRSS
jgi:hypothetical protein